ncbi:MAG: hypothetical protein DRO88_08105 [Promethearchaeia archaeon]|nr:MAG: hypothetical protein DRO88_08105 [Candidatus Lokiarchaeia archaeon]
MIEKIEMVKMLKMVEMVSNRKFFIYFLQFSGIVEMIVALAFFTFPLFADLLEIDLGIPLFFLFSAISFFALGFLLWYATKDPYTYRIIIYVSCAFRFLMVIPEVSTIVFYPRFLSILLIGLGYDWFSSILTLILLKKYCKSHENTEDK